ncbi:SRPBCC family protein [Aggregatilinea lenta]|uniref:SRPBCC family protein n=1 Tax=Aggregatilinea lenta TaxID=913108 RepID=UPI000E5C3929|nr:SRPBCC domain-containing protein [Aggregatilinea lenta]
MQKQAIERNVWIDAPRERVWQALVDPAQVEQWFSPGTPWELSAQGVGGRLFVRDTDTGGELYTQVIETYEPPDRLILHSEDEPPTVTDYTLADENGGTRLTLVYSGYGALSDDERAARIEQDSAGFELMLGNIKAVVEGAPLPNPQGF